jgi:hypothetical protein
MIGKIIRHLKGSPYTTATGVATLVLSGIIAVNDPTVLTVEEKRNEWLVLVASGVTAIAVPDPKKKKREEDK